MWCQNCQHETQLNICELCGNKTDPVVPTEIYWCSDCRIPVIREKNDPDRNRCPLCGGETKYLAADLRVVFPEERLLFELLVDKPLEYKGYSVWASNNRYYVDGKPYAINSRYYTKYDPDILRQKLQEYGKRNDYSEFKIIINKFIDANSSRLNNIVDEAHSFIAEQAKLFPSENVVVSFSGGKDSTVTADLTINALRDPSVVHIFGNTTLEFPTTLEYAKRYRNSHPLTIFKTAENTEQDFMSVCEDIGPPARMMRWCCSMFKTGPITRVLSRYFRDTKILTFYGIRRDESVARSKYNRVEDESESLKIRKQTVATPIFYWNDIDIWLYILSMNIDFNDAYRLGYDRVGCWCCPNNNTRAQFLSSIYMPEQYKKWRDFLLDFAKKIGKPDPEVYVDTGKWKARQGGNGVRASEDIKLRFTNCTSEEHAKIYRLNRAMNDEFINMLVPFGIVSKELGRKLLNEVLVLDQKTNVPIIAVQPFHQADYEYSVKVKTMNVESHDDLQRMVGYQVKKFNACRKCLKCESLCRFGAISIIGDEYHIDENKCRRCKVCVTSKYLDGGCMMEKYLRTKKGVC